MQRRFSVLRDVSGKSEVLFLLFFSEALSCLEV